MTQSRLKEIMSYDQHTGLFTYKKRVISQGRINKRAGKIAGTLDKSTGYIKFTIDYQKLLAHRMAALYMLGYIPEEVDHDDHIRNNNKWSNLNLSTKKENSKNKTKLSNNTSGITGVTWDKQNKKWVAQIKIPGKTVKKLGRFIEKKDAIDARVKAELKYGYHKNHGR